MARKANKAGQEGVLTTFDAAKICNANVNSIKNWIAQGKLKAYRTPGGHYRIERRHLREFLHEHDMPDPFGPLRQRILAVDDNQTTLEALELVFAEDYDLTSARDGYEALVLIGKDPPDLVLLDIFMPGLDGLQVIQRLRELDFLSSTHLVAYSGSPDPDIERRAMEAGAVAFWRKSGDLSELQELVGKVLTTG